MENDILHTHKITIRSIDEMSELKKTIVTDLKDIYWAEKQLLKVLSKLERAATTRYLKASFKGHLQATKEHVTRIEEAFKLLNEKALAKKCAEMQDLVIEAGSVINNTEKNTLLRDLALITTAQKLENYEINKYGKIIRTCDALGEHNVSALLYITLAEEKEAIETFMAVKEDTENDELFKLAEQEAEEFEAAEEE